jgi:hypothetical protein
MNIIPEVEVDFYRSYNADLQGLDDAQLLDHYERHGPKGGYLTGCATGAILSR